MKLFKHLTANEEILEPFPFKRELSMESYLIENEGILSLDDDVLSDVSVIQEELTLKQGRSSKDTDGRIDILATYSNEYIGVVELKLGELNDIHLTQLEDYLAKKENILSDFSDLFDSSLLSDPKWIGVLVGSSITSDLRQKISAGYTADSGVLLAALILQRYRGANGSVYVSTEVIFRGNLRSKDFRKYKYKNKNFGKGRLVLEVMKDYSNKNPEVTFAQLQKVFPPAVQGASGVFTSKDDAIHIYEKTNRRRHFLKPIELIEIQDETIAICNQWGIDNIDSFVKRARGYGFEIHDG
jgi:hypothetical protein